jgi:cell division protein ZapA
MKKTYDLNIAGMSFKLRSSHDEQTVKELVEFVDGKTSEAMQALKSGSFQSAAVLAALNIAEELILLKRRARRELEILEDRALKLSQNLENSKTLKGPSGQA